MQEFKNKESAKPDDLLTFDLYYGLHPVDNYIYFLGFHKQAGLSVNSAVVDFDMETNTRTMISYTRLPTGGLASRKDVFSFNDEDDTWSAVAYYLVNSKWKETRPDIYRRMEN